MALTKVSPDMVDAKVLDRANHTGTQPISATVGLQDALQKYAFRAHKNGVNQTPIASGVSTKLTFSIEAFDINSMFDAANSRVVLPKDGPVHLSAAAYITVGVADAAYTLNIYKNGVAIAARIHRPATTSGVAIGIVVDDNGVAGDIYEVWVNLAGAGDKTAFGSAGQTYFCGHMI